MTANLAGVHEPFHRGKQLVPPLDNGLHFGVDIGAQVGVARCEQEGYGVRECDVFFFPCGDVGEKAGLLFLALK